MARKPKAVTSTSRAAGQRKPVSKGPAHTKSDTQRMKPMRHRPKPKS